MEKVENYNKVPNDDDRLIFMIYFSDVKSDVGLVFLTARRKNFQSQ